MSGVIANIPKFQFFDSAGVAVNYQLFTYLAGTLTPAITYQDQGLTSANTNPIILDARGECAIWLANTKAYKFVLATPAGATVWTTDNISGARPASETITVREAGAVSYFATASAPAGWLKANGASLSTTSYADLFDAIGYTFGGSGSYFNIPDLRGEFIRSLDDSRGVDAGRSLGTFQGDQNKSHNHGGYSAAQSTDHAHSGTTGGQSNSHTHGYNEPTFDFASAFAAGTSVSRQVTAGTTGGASTDHSHGFTTGGVSANHSHAIGSDGGTEVRVRNVAMLAAIKY